MKYIIVGNQRIREKSIAGFAYKHRVALSLLAVVIVIVVGMVVASELAEATTSNETAQTDQFVKVNKMVAETSEKQLYSVPLEEELQLHIIDLCNDYNVEPELVLAVIGQESNYNSEAIGDDGKSFGLMQVQKKFHETRMTKVGVADLLNPYDNVTVGIDILAECLNEGKGLEWALHCYNGWVEYADYMEATGQVSDYTESVLMLYEELKGE